jgi:hypothetical protein
VLIGREAATVLDTLSATELEALAAGDLATTRRYQRAVKRWRDGRA